MNYTIRDRLIFICILAATALSIYSRITSPTIQLEDPYKGSAYDRLGNSNAPLWYYKDFTKGYDGRLEWEKHKINLLKERVEGSIGAVKKYNDASTGVYHIDALRRQEAEKEKEKSDKEKLINFISSSLKSKGVTPVQSIVLEKMLSGLREEEKSTKEKVDVEPEPEKTKEDPSFVEKMENKLNIDTQEVIKNINDRKRSFNFGIFKLTPREDHSKLDKNISGKGRLLLASSYYGGYGYSDSTDDSNYDDYYNYDDADVDYGYEYLGSEPVTEDDYAEQLKEYQSGLSPAEKQKLLNNRNDYKKYEGYQGAKSIDDYQKQMSDFMGDDGSINDLVNDVGSGIGGDSFDSDGDYGKVQGLFSNQKVNKDQIESFKKGNNFFNNSGSVYDKVKKDTRKDMNLEEQNK